MQLARALQVNEETRKVIEVIENDFTSQSKVAIADKMSMCALCGMRFRVKYAITRRSRHGSSKVLGALQRCASRERRG